MTKKRILLSAIIIATTFVGIWIISTLKLVDSAAQEPTASITLIPIATAVPTAEIESTRTPGVFYVSPQGNNENVGSENKPWQTIQFAANQTKPGDTIIVKSGTYVENVHVTHAGEPDRPISLIAADGDGVLIDGGADPALIGEGNYWVLRGFQLTSKADRTLRIGSSFWQIRENKITGAVYFWGNNNLFKMNEVDGSQHTGNENGVMDDGPSSHNNVFRRNMVHDFELRGFWSQWLTHDNLFEENEIFNITAETGMGIDLDAASNVGYRHTVRGNIIHDCAQTGIELENSYASLVENNFIYNTGLEGIQVINYKGCTVGGEDNQYGDVNGNCEGDELDTIVRQNVIINGGRVGGIVSYHSSGVKLYNNTVYGSGAGFYILGDASQADNWDLQGNIFAHNSRVQISLEDPKSFLADQYNIVYQSDSDEVYEIRGTESVFYSLAEWEGAFGLGKNSIEADPLFADPEKMDLHLQPGSPAIDVAVDLEITADMENNPKPAGNGYDIGAYEQ
ncbi:MAG: right-handed parallel beta-helix repeat-containing protein [Anaerolineaceae bacterium]